MHKRTIDLLKKKTVKTLSIIFLAAVMTFSYGCSSTSPGTVDEKIGIIVSIPPQAEFAEKVGGKMIDVTVMVPPGASPHTHEPTPGQLKDVSRAKLYLKVGSGIEFELAWMDKIIKMNKEMHVIDCSRGISLIDNDPHIWLSVENAIIMVENIYAGLVEIDPENKDLYYKNKNDFQAELSSLNDYIKDTLEEKKNRQIMVYHPAWTYFTEAYDLEQIPIEEEGKEPTMGGMQQIIEKAKKLNIKVIFASPEFSTRSAETIASEIGGSVMTISPLEKDYTSNMKNVAEAFAESMQ